MFYILQRIYAFFSAETMLWNVVLCLQYSFFRERYTLQFRNSKWRNKCPFSIILFHLLVAYLNICRIRSHCRYVCCPGLTKLSPRVPWLGGSQSSHQGVQPLISRPGGALALRVATPACAQHDHGLSGNTDHGPGPRQLPGMVWLCLEQDPWHPQGKLPSSNVSC